VRPGESEVLQHAISQLSQKSSAASQQKPNEVREFKYAILPQQSCAKALKLASSEYQSVETERRTWR
jgi:hypothetical protein